MSSKPFRGPTAALLVVAGSLSLVACGGHDRPSQEVTQASNIYCVTVASRKRCIESPTPARKRALYDCAYAEANDMLVASFYECIEAEAPNEKDN